MRVGRQEGVDEWRGEGRSGALTVWALVGYSAELRLGWIGEDVDLVGARWGKGAWNDGDGLRLPMEPQGVRTCTRDANSSSCNVLDAYAPPPRSCNAQPRVTNSPQHGTSSACATSPGLSSGMRCQNCQVRMILYHWSWCGLLLFLIFLLESGSVCSPPVHQAVESFNLKQVTRGKQILIRPVHMRACVRSCCIH